MNTIIEFSTTWKYILYITRIHITIQDWWLHVWCNNIIYSDSGWLSNVDKCYVELEGILWLTSVGVVYLPGVTFLTLK